MTRSHGSGEDCYERAHVGFVFLTLSLPRLRRVGGAAFFDGGQAPLAALGWPRSAEEAQAMTRQPLDFVQCAACGHVWTRAFRYDDIPYREQPNRMFNAGLIWRGHLAELAEATLWKNIFFYDIIFDI